MFSEFVKARLSPSTKALDPHTTTGCLLFGGCRSALDGCGLSLEPPTSKISPPPTRKVSRFVSRPHTLSLALSVFRSGMSHSLSPALSLTLSLCVCVCCLLFVVCCLLFVVYCLLFVVCCLLFVVCCLLFVVCCLLFVVV